MATATGTYATRAAVKTRLGITDSTDDALIDSLCDQVNQYIETRTGRVLAPIASATYTFDSNGARRLHVPNGVRAVTLLEVAPNTGGTFETVSASNYAIRPTPVEPAWPSSYIEFVDLVSSGYYYFPRGYGTIRVTMTTGPAAIPDDITELALTMVVRRWRARQSGQNDIVGTNEFGTPIVSRWLSKQDHDLLDYYSGRALVS